MLLQRQVKSVLGLSLLLFVIICLCTQQTQAGQATYTKCAKFGEYCQNHWDCCSNSCLSYMYRCTRNYQAIYPYPFLSPQYEQPGYTTMEDILGSNFGYADTAIAPAPTTRRARSFPEQLRLVRIDDTKESASESAGKASEVYEIVTEETPTTETSSSLTEAAGTGEESEASHDNRLQCKEVGLKCFRNEECCTMRCHGYLHQCVT